MSATERQYRVLETLRNQALANGAPFPADWRAQMDTLAAKLAKPKAPRKPSTEPQERDILKAIMHLLHRHPRVAKAWRQNSMTAQFNGRDGKPRFVRANTAQGMADIMGILKDGRTLAIEVKTPTGAVQPHQQAFLDAISSAGGLAFVARSVDDVTAALATMR